MTEFKPINLFYEEPPMADRWFPTDRYARHIVRRIVRGKPRPGGQMRVFLNLCAGLDRIGVSYQVNQYGYINHHPEELAGVIGKPHLLDKICWRNPIIFGAAVFSHPLDDPDLLNRLPVKKVLVPGEWMRKMWEPYWGEQVIAWPVGIDTDKWNISDRGKDIDILLYDKVRWKHEKYEIELIEPIKRLLQKKQLKTETIRYGFYKEENFQALLERSKAMIFLCEHETQGIAYQQALSCGVPILAWDRGGFWQDPSHYPHKVKFAPVTSVPYWDERCGTTFISCDEFPEKLEEFWDKLQRQEFAPRDYVIENLTLMKCARQYVEILKEVNP